MIGVWSPCFNRLITKYGVECGDGALRVRRGGSRIGGEFPDSSGQSKMQRISHFSRQSTLDLSRFCVLRTLRGSR